MPTFRLSQQACPVCFTRLDAATNVAGKGAPEEGDHTVCIECGAVLRFDSRLRLVPSSLQDVDVTLRARLARVVFFVGERKAGKFEVWMKGRK